MELIIYKLKYFFFPLINMVYKSTIILDEISQLPPNLSHFVRYELFHRYISIIRVLILISLIERLILEFLDF